MLLNSLLKPQGAYATGYISLDTPPRNQQCYQCQKMIGTCKSWTNMDCFDKKTSVVLRFFAEGPYGFICSACYSPGHTQQSMCKHLMTEHSEGDLVKMGLSSVHVARGAGG